MKTLIGKVTRDMSRSACYARINIPQVDGIPLSVKANITGFSKNQFAEGTVVEVVRSTADGRKFGVVAVYVDAEKHWPGVDCHHSQDDKVRFWIGSRYTHDMQLNRAMFRVLTRTLGFGEVDAERYLRAGGFWVICRESQFARFLIARNEEGLPNLFQDLRVAYRDMADLRHEIDISDR